MKSLILRRNGPWGPANNDDENNKGQNKSPDQDLDDFIRKGQQILKKFLSSNGNYKNPNNNSSGNNNNTSKTIISGLIVTILLTLWLISGFYKVDSDENAVILYFGKFHSIAKPGLNYRLPAPFSKAIKRSVTTVNTVDFGENFGSKYYNSNEDSSLMLTGDENIVDIDFQIQWKISDIKNYVFNVADTKIAIQKSAESAMREVIARTPIANALSDGKKNIEFEVKNLLQEILDSYNSGIEIVLVQLLRVDPPKQVIDSFRDVQTAKADKEKEINQAEAFKNDVIPRARGEAEKLIQEAEAYKEAVISDAIGQTERFLSVYNEYRKAKNVTKRRIYLETMEKIYENTDKIIIDQNISKSGVLPYIPLNELKKKND